MSSWFRGRSGPVHSQSCEKERLILVPFPRFHHPQLQEAPPPAQRRSSPGSSAMRAEASETRRAGSARHLLSGQERVRRALLMPKSTTKRPLEKGGVQQQGLIRSVNRQATRDKKAHPGEARRGRLREPSACECCGAVFGRRTWRRAGHVTLAMLDRADWTHVSRLRADQERGGTGTYRRLWSVRGGARARGPVHASAMWRRARRSRSSSDAWSRWSGKGTSSRCSPRRRSWRTASCTS